MKVLGIRGTKDSLMWAVVEGRSRQDAVVAAYAKASAPAGDRGAQLVWVRKEVHELLDQHKPDTVAIRVADPSGQGNSLPRAETDGVVLEAVAFRGVTCRIFFAATVRGHLAARTTAELNAALAEIPATAKTPASRRDPVAVAMALFPTSQS
jgi:Holliday junction resolvasome RuvABC endonuclease subunit